MWPSVRSYITILQANMHVMSKLIREIQIHKVLETLEKENQGQWPSSQTKKKKWCADPSAEMSYGHLHLSKGR